MWPYNLISIQATKLADLLQYNARPIKNHLPKEELQHYCLHQSHWRDAQYHEIWRTKQCNSGLSRRK